MDGNSLTSCSEGQVENKKMVGLSLTIVIITLNVNGLNPSIRMHPFLILSFLLFLS